jgi:hypothetical protein
MADLVGHRVGVAARERRRRLMISTTTGMNDTATIPTRMISMSLATIGTWPRN